MGKSNLVSRGSAQLRDHHRRPLSAAPPSEPFAAPRSAHVPHERSDPAEIQLWNREAAPFARDLLFMMAIFFYMVGFAHQSSKMGRFGMEVQLGDQPLSNLFSWAAEAIEDGWIGFLLIFIAIAVVICAAAYLKHRLVGSIHYRPVVYGLVTVAVVGGTVAAGFHAWSTGVTRADSYAATATVVTGGHKPNPVRMFADPAKGVAFLGTPKAPTPVYIISETNDMFEVMATQHDGTGMPLALRRADIVYIQYHPNSDNNPTILKNGELKVTKSKIPTPSPSQVGF